MAESKSSPPPHAHAGAGGVRPPPVRLRQVHVFHRHGHRTASALFESKKKEKAQWEALLGDNASLKNSDATQRGIEPRLTGMKVEAMDPDARGRDQQFCDQSQALHFLGRLTPKGESQMLELGKRLRERYVDRHRFLPGELKVRDLVVQSTPLRRTVYSLNHFLLGLYPTETRRDGHEPIRCGVDFYSDDEILFPRWCPRFAQLALSAANSIPATPEIVHVAKMFKHDTLPTDIYVWARLYDVIYCRRINGFELPQTWSDEHFQVLKNHKLQLWNSAYDTMESQKLSMGHCMETVLKRLHALLCGQSHTRMHVYSCHDNTLFVFLKLLTQNKNVEWPDYSSHLTFELWENYETNEFFIHIIYNGTKLTEIPNCPPVRAYPSGKQNILRYEDFRKQMGNFVVKNFEEEGREKFTAETPRRSRRAR